MRKLIPKYMPSILLCFAVYFSQRSFLFRSPVVSAVIEGIVDDHTKNVNLMSSILASEII